MNCALRCRSSANTTADRGRLKRRAALQHEQYDDGRPDYSSHGCRDISIVMGGWLLEIHGMRSCVRR